ncbi:M13 family peptidase [Lactobacillus sp. CC-MHH1034]|uniref:M13 family metallopeptidase n=1 Tax=Agrilactobacillus fermenti TaxID=2586909 RepID=UPI001E3A301C|nr:M13-type metalloendopeptidase [Agrilactobacillus fermenti]MCD2255594.1 M13 family peptidase [Agrilactobacillus fermenti]
MDNNAYRQDLYQAVNGAWEKTAVIPSDKPTTGGFADLADGVEKQLMQDFADAQAGKKKFENPLMSEVMKLYRVAQDFDKRDQLGAKPVLPDLAKIEQLTQLSDLQAQLTAWYREFPTPFGIQVDADMKDTAVNVVYAFAPSLFLPDKPYYDADNENGKQLLTIFKDMSLKLLTMVGKTEAEAKTILDHALAFDRSLVPYVKSAEEWADYTSMYNPETFTTFSHYSSNLALGQLVQDLVADTPERVIVAELRFFENFDKIVNPAAFADLKAWLYLNKLLSSANVLSEDFRQVGGTYNRALSGSKEAMSQIKSAYYLASNRFSQVVGDYYGKTYFGDAARQDVKQMVEKMIDVYKKRLHANNWLSQATKEKAILKLNKIVIKVGYPDQIKPIYEKMHVDDTKSLYEIVKALNAVVLQDNLDKYHRPVDRTEWGMPAQMVNAMYDPSRNDITFPAAILQAPFYSLAQSDSQNYGGIGAVIAHEISHAFDNNGAKFDEFGNMNNWWTDEDYQIFKQLTQAMIDEFDGIEFAGGKVNGKLVVSENVADAGGLSCALEATKAEADADLRAFFINWARIWRMKATEQYKQLRLATDVHAPNVLRANVQPKNLDDFYATFDVQPGDGMYLDPDKRVKIW